MKKKKQRTNTRLEMNKSSCKIQDKCFFIALSRYAYKSSLEKEK